MSATDIRILSGLSELATRYDVVLCDVWGVVHDGRRAFGPAVEALRTFRQGGGTVLLLTNAARPHGPVELQLGGLGVERDSYDAVVTSGDATLALVVARGSASAYHIGPSRDHALFREVAALTDREPVFGRPDEAAYAICTGLFDDARETPDDYADLLATLRSRGLDMICANPDLVVHVGDRLTFCAGALAKRYTELGGTVFYAGKPHAPIYDLAFRRAAECRGSPVDPGRVLAIGDGLGTDIMGARRQGLDSLFVTTGIHRDDTLDPRSGKIDPAALAAMLAAAGEAPVAAIQHLAW